MTRKKRYIIILLNLLIFSSCNFFLSGSYPYAEYYTFNMSNDELIDRIKKFKDENPRFKVMTTFEDGEKGELPDEYTDNFYHIYFYLEDKNMTLHCIININGEDKSTNLGLDAVSKEANFGDWKTINTKEMSDYRNDQIKKMFETRILDKLGIWEYE